ncbi:MAG: kinase domain-containing [Lasallia pustulata]|uniref:Kinase domain-containing n=1 Tax=Lasallia pustulata TaxID=136370 RepID=A0A5M8Q150_9LECA|nr:MAG: kinase domain-containing [Lasallia pustulata]
MLHDRGGNANGSGGIKGKWLGGLKLKDASTLQVSEQRLEGKEKKLFLNFMLKMLRWLPEKRATAQQLLDDPWLNSPSNDEEDCASLNRPSESDA